MKAGKPIPRPESEEPRRVREVMTPFGVTKEILDEWLSRILNTRSRGHGGLKNRNGLMCDLGQLCDVLDPDAWVIRPDKDRYSWYGAVGTVSSHMVRLKGHTLLKITDQSDSPKFYKRDVRAENIRKWVTPELVTLQDIKDWSKGGGPKVRDW